MKQLFVRGIFLFKFHSLFALICSTLCFVQSFAQWREANNGIFGGQVSCLISSKGNIFAGTPGGIFVSKDNGNSWTAFGSGLDNAFIKTLAATIDGRVFAVTQGGSKVFVTTPPYISWAAFRNGLPSSNLESLATINKNTFVLTSEGTIYKIGEAENLWSVASTGLSKVNSITSSGQNLFAATSEGVFLSTDNGVIWKASNDGLIEKSIFSITSVGNNLIASSTSSPVFFSNNLGVSWTMASLETGNYRLIETNGILFAGNQSRVYFSNNRGITWDQVRLLPGATDFVVIGSTILASNRYGIYKSVNTGQTWNSSNASELSNANVIGFTSDATNVFCGTSSGVYHSNDVGKSWKVIDKGLPLDKTTAIQWANSKLFVALSSYGIYESTNNGNSWTFSIGVPNIRSFANLGETLFAGGDDGIYFLNKESWTRLRAAPSQVKDLFVKTDTLFACSSNTGISFSTDRGETWKFTNEGLPFIENEFSTIHSFQNKLVVGSQRNGSVYYQPKIFSAWQRIETNLANTDSNTSFAADSINFFAGGSNGVFTLSSTGLNWRPYYNEQLPLLSSPSKIESLHIHRSHLYAGTTGNCVWVSCIEPSKPKISAIAIEPNETVFASNYPEGNQWFLNGELIPNATNDKLKPTLSGQYSVKVNLDGCESKLSDSRNFEAPGDPLLIMPNVFTPNGDASNPLFLPIRYENISEANLKIVDKWGNEIFKTSKVVNGWNGSNQDTGIYFYLIQFVGLNGAIGEVKGWVHLIR